MLAVDEQVAILSFHPSHDPRAINAYICARDMCVCVTYVNDQYNMHNGRFLLSFRSCCIPWSGVSAGRICLAGLGGALACDMVTVYSAVVAAPK